MFREDRNEWRRFVVSHIQRGGEEEEEEEEEKKRKKKNKNKNKDNKKLSYCWETVRRESMPRIAEMDVKMTT